MVEVVLLHAGRGHGQVPWCSMCALSLGRCEVEEPGWFRQVKRGEDLLPVGSQRGALCAVLRGGEGAQVEAVELRGARQPRTGSRPLWRCTRDAGLRQVPRRRDPLFGQEPSTRGDHRLRRQLTALVRMGSQLLPTSPSRRCSTPPRRRFWAAAGSSTRVRMLWACGTADTIYDPFRHRGEQLLKPPFDLESASAGSNALYRQLLADNQGASGVEPGAGPGGHRGAS